MRIYIAGPIDCEPIVTEPVSLGARQLLRQRVEHFSRAEAYLLKKGHAPVNPLVGAVKDASREDHIKRDIRLLLECEAIYLLRGWEASPGAKLEADIAAATGITRLYENAFECPTCRT